MRLAVSQPVQYSLEQWTTDDRVASRLPRPVQLLPALNSTIKAAYERHITQDCKQADLTGEFNLGRSRILDPNREGNLR